MKSRSLSHQTFPLWVIGITILATFFVLIVRGATPLAIVWTSLAAFWLAFLPGTLVVTQVTDRPLNLLTTWVLGAAVGMNFLPIGSLLMFVLPPDVAWITLAVALSVWNLSHIKHLWNIRNNESYSVPILYAAGLLLVWTSYLYFEHTSLFYRTSSHYFFDSLLGGDVPYLSGIALAFEHSPILHDPHFGGFSFLYHDFTLRWIAGLHYFIGGDIYDVSWYFSSSFCAALLFVMAYVTAYEFTKSRWAALAMLPMVLLYAGKSTAIFSENSDSFRFGLIQCFAILQLYADHIRNPKKEIGWILIIVIAMLASWKLPAALVLVPALLIAEIWKGKTIAGHWSRVGFIGGGILIAMGYALWMSRWEFVPQNGFVVGRPMGFHSHLLSILSLHSAPSFLLSDLNWGHVKSFLVLLPVFFAWMLLWSPRTYALFFTPKWMNVSSERIPFLRQILALSVIAAILFGLSLSPRYFGTSEIYYRFYGLALGSLWLLMTVKDLFHNSARKEHRISCSFFIIALIVTTLFEFPLALLDHASLITEEKRSLPRSLIESLQMASAVIPNDARIASRRFDLDTSSHFDPAKSNTSGHTWNFEFYATALDRRMVLEGPSNGLLGGMATNRPDTMLNLAPSPAAFTWLRNTIHMIDTLYESSNPAAVRIAITHLRATHLFVDHTIHQQIVAARLISDTVFNDSNVTVLKFR